MALKTVAQLIRNLDDALNITVPIAIHLDHGDYEAAKSAIQAGFTSIMFDGSHLPLAIFMVAIPLIAQG